MFEVEVLVICLINSTIYQVILCTVKIHVTLCLTYLLNNKNCNACFLTICFYRLCPKQVLKTNEPSLFPLHRSQSNHHKQGFYITTSKISYNLTEPQVLLCVPQVLTCGCKFYAHVLYLHPAFIASSQSQAYLSTPHLQHFPNERRIQNPVEHLRLSFFVKAVNVLKSLIIFAEKLHCRCSTGFQLRLCPIICYSQ